MNYIPLKSHQNLKRKAQILSGTFKRKKTKHVSDRSLDPILYRRIEDLVDTGSSYRTLTVEKIISTLQKKYREYKRRKIIPFRIAIENVLVHMEENESTDSDLISDDQQIETVEYPDTNMVNESLTKLYKKPSNQKETKMKKSSNSSSSSCQNTSAPDENNESLPIIETVESSGKKRRNKKTNDLEMTEQKVNKKNKDIIIQHSTVMFADLGGIEETLEEICKLLIHLKHPEVYQHLGVIPPRGFLLHGPPGCGKTLLAHAIAGELELPFIKVAATEIVSGVSGESEEKIRDLFERAVTCAPCILFIDEIDAITPKRETAQREMERRIVAQLLTCLDDLNQKDATTQVLVIGATNRPDSLDPALRRAGRFDREISLGIPNEAARSRILKVLCHGLKLRPDLEFVYLAHQTPGFVGADLMALTREAATCAINRVFISLQSDISDENQTKSKLEGHLSWLKDQSPLTEKQLTNLFIEKSDFEFALKQVQPSAKREGFATVPNTTWDDIGALKNIREELQLAILAPVKHKEKFEEMGLTTSVGILLCGPPGCGKTLLAKAVANESGINFISVKGPELLNMYVGESERAVRQVFQRAQNSSPCVIFFDEIDALCPKRSDTAESGSSARVVNQLLTEMDGLESRKQVFIMAATNRPDIIDPAMLRPGRLDKILYVGLPTPDDRTDILRTLTKNGTKPCLGDIDISSLGHDSRCEGFTGADLAALVREASVTALKEVFKQENNRTDSTVVQLIHFEEAFSKVRPSVSLKEQKMYGMLKYKV